MLLRSKEETFPVFAIFAKQVLLKLNDRIIAIKSDHEAEFKNAKINEFCSKFGIDHNFSTPRIPQQMVVLKEKQNSSGYCSNHVDSCGNYQKLLG